MTRIILNDDQVKAVHNAEDAIELRDQHGELLGYITRTRSDAKIAEAQRRLSSPGPWHTTDQVLEQIDSLGQG